MNPRQFPSHNESEFPDFENADIHITNRTKNRNNCQSNYKTDFCVFVCIGIFLGVAVAFVQGVQCG